MSHQIHYTVKGSGQPLVLVHGWAMHAGVWQGFNDLLAEHCMTVKVDLRGHGASKAMEGPHTFERYALDLIGLLEEANLRDAALLGWSMGASLVLKMHELGYCGTGPLVLVGANPSLVKRNDYENGLAPVVVRRLFRQLQRDYHGGLRTFLKLLCTPQEHDRLSADPAYLSAMDTAACPDQEVALSTLACLQAEDLRPAAAHITAPTLIVHGEQDEICLSSGGCFLAGSIPGAQTLMLPHTGHMPFISRREDIVTAVLDFLAYNSHQAAHKP
jgi:pimeloyl-[acyl-carrier protein] methyl ester esterase